MHTEAVFAGLADRSGDGRWEHGRRIGARTADGVCGRNGGSRTWAVFGFADGDGDGVEIEIVLGRKPDGNGGREMLATQKLKMLKCHEGER